VNLADEVLDHLLGGVEIRDHAFAHRADRLDRTGGPAEHQLGVLTHGQHFLDPVLDVVGDHRRLVQNHAPALHVDQRVRGPEVDRHVRREKP
jgi:hypothetical protein